MIVFGAAVGVGIRGDNLPAEFDGLEIEGVVVTEGAIPDIFGGVFPVGFGAPSFFAFPGNAVADLKMLIGGLIY